MGISKCSNSSMNSYITVIFIAKRPFVTTPEFDPFYILPRCVA
jgi:hypothetical protein